jgi:hypothetical protein
VPKDSSGSHTSTTRTRGCGVEPSSAAGGVSDELPLPVAARVAGGHRCTLGVNRRFRAQADRNLAALARAVEVEPGLTVAEYAELIASQVTWKHPATAIRQHACAGLGALGRHRLIYRDGRLWPATTR